MQAAQEGNTIKQPYPDAAPVDRDHDQDDKTHIGMRSETHMLVATNRHLTGLKALGGMENMPGTGNLTKDKRCHGP